MTFLVSLWAGWLKGRVERMSVVTSCNEHSNPTGWETHFDFSPMVGEQRRCFSSPKLYTNICSNLNFSAAFIAQARRQTVTTCLQYFPSLRSTCPTRSAQDSTVVPGSIDPNLEQHEEKQVSQCEEEQFSQWEKQQFSLGLMERPLSAGQVFLDEVGDQEHHLVDLLKNLLTTGASSCNTAHTEEEEEEGKRDEEKEEGERKMAGEEAPKNSRCQRKNGRRPRRTASCGSALSPAYRHARWGQGYDLTVRGKSLDLVSRLPALCTELPLLAEDSGGGGAWDLDSGAKRSCIFAAVKPSNVDMERTKFFLSDYTYNPQFEYPHPVPAAALERYSTASDRFLTQLADLHGNRPFPLCWQAVRILEQALRRYGSYEKFELATGGSVLSKNKIKNHVKKYMEKEGVVGEVR
ncbi:hypothetical protein JZ751_004317 [Albula glossodonta]|uniref:Uncharacterized protein n=1 Tax=Albula glossodonta TaxID=121402 RepID=A0A8T2N5J6_9TELE|nr:hypothetical protein JZ751_004317 [Albula glossodonta]